MKKFISVLILLLIGVPAYAAPVVIDGANIQDNTVTSTKLVNVDNAKLIDNNVSGTKILDNSVALEKMAAIGSDNAAYLRRDGTWSIPSITTATVILSSYKNLKITTPADHQSVTITADSVVAVDDNNVARIVSTVSLTVNLDVAGANGLDTGAIAANTGYYLYVIDNGATTAGLASLSATAPAMPAGYTYKALVGWCTTDGTVTPFNIEEFTQIDDEYIWTVPQKVVNAFASSPNTQTISLSSTGISGYAVASPLAKVALGKAYLAGGTGLYLNPVTFANGQTVNSASTLYELGMQYGSATGLPYRIPLVESQTFYWQLDGAQGTATIWVSGFTLKR